MTMPQTAFGRIVAAGLILFAILFIVWWAIWSIAAGQYSGVIDGWIGEGRASGYEIEYDNRTLSGFPRQLILHFTNVRWKTTSNIQFRAADIDVAATPWQWQKFDVTFTGRVELAAPVDEDNQALALSGEDGHVRLVLDKAGFWKSSEINMKKAKFGSTPNYLFLADELETSVERPDETPRDHKDVGLTLHGYAKTILVPPGIVTPFGSSMEEAEIEARVMGAMPDFRRKESVMPWNQGMGVVEFDRLYMNWGPLKVTAKGTMGFDDDLQPEGAFAAGIGNHEQVLQALMEHNFIAKRQEAMLNSALSLFAKPDDDTGLQIPVTIQLGGLFLGPVRIFEFPEIEWPEGQ